MTPTFYLGTHETGWLKSPTAPGPFFVSVRRLRRIKHWRPSVHRWALDSGGFTELSQFGRWKTTPHQYAAEVSRAREEIGKLDWAAPQDWMCEPSKLEATGLTVRAHQDLTTSNFLTLSTLIPGAFIPVLQGWTEAEYVDHVEQYAAAGVDLTTFDTVGVGSVCRRGQDNRIVSILETLSGIIGPRLHGFGVRSSALARSTPFLKSADSMAWSFNARRNPPLPGCPHASCSNCVRWAGNWRRTNGRFGTSDYQARLFT